MVWEELNFLSHPHKLRRSTIEIGGTPNPEKPSELFEKNYYLINEANKFLETQNKSFSLSLNHYADIIDFDDQYSTTTKTKC